MNKEPSLSHFIQGGHISWGSPMLQPIIRLEERQPRLVRKLKPLHTAVGKRQIVLPSILPLPPLPFRLPFPPFHTVSPLKWAQG